jgi:hypothetical protein
MMPWRQPTIVTSVLKISGAAGEATEFRVRDIIRHRVKLESKFWYESERGVR